jgi:putative ABC transport system permease protein
MLVNSLKIAWKVLLQHPFYTFITLFGISLTLTVLMVVTSFLDHLFAAHYPETKRDRMLFVANIVRTDSANTTRTSGSPTFGFLTKYVKSLKTPEEVAIFSNFSFSNTYINGKRIKLNAKYTDAQFWQVTGFEFLEGKPYSEQNIRNGDHVAVITDSFRDQYFEKNTGSVIGKNVEIESIHYKVIGVVRGSPVTRVYTYSDVYFPYTAPKSNYENKGMMGRYVAMVLARDKSDWGAIQSEFDSGIAKIPIKEIAEGQGFNILIVSADTYLDNFLNVFARDMKDKILVYTLIVLVLLMFMGLPAINLVNVNVSRILERASEIGVRKAFGAPSKALLWQFIIENIFITFIGGAFALAFASLLIYMINASGWIPYADLTINFTIFTISVLVCLFFGLFSGVLPAFRMSRLKIVDALKA